MPDRDITSFVTRAMLLGNISSLGIPRDDIEKAVRRYCIENPRSDVTQMPLIGFSDKNETSKAIIALAKRHCGPRGSKTAVFSKDFHSVIIFGRSAQEIMSKIDFSNVKVEFLKTKIKIDNIFPANRKLKCFGGEKVADYIKAK